MSNQSDKVPEATVQIPGELYRDFEGWVRSAGYGLEEIQSQTLPGDDWYRLFKVEPIDDMPKET